MNIQQLIRLVCFALVFPPIPFPAAAEELTNAIRVFLQQRAEAERPGGIVVGLVDGQGSRIVSWGVTVHGVKRILLEELLSVVEEGVRKYPATEKEQGAH